MGLNAPFGAWCFLTSLLLPVESLAHHPVVMHLLALGASDDKIENTAHPEGKS